MRRFKRGAYALAAATLALTGLAGTAAEAAPPLKCGAVITENTTLTANLSNCRGNGLVVAANGITLNLGGRTVSGRQSPAETIGILLDNVTGVTVRNGTVTGFDAGVVVRGGSANTVTAITARDNINDNVAAAGDKLCAYGDGIVVEGSDGNTLSSNRVVHNGPFSGISLIFDSDSNTVRGNTVLDSNVPNTSQSGTGQCGSPFSRPIQDIGIRVEGPGADDNVVTSNRVVNSAIGGITVHGYVWDPPPAGTEDSFPRDNPNTGNLIQFNYVDGTGAGTFVQDSLADGIGILRQGPSAVVGVSQGNTIDSNTVINSRRHGIFVGNPTQPGPHAGNTVTNNTVHYSLVDGINLANGAVNNTIIGNTARYNGEHDGHDNNTNCDNNLWSNNIFDWVNQACVSATAGVR